MVERWGSFYIKVMKKILEAGNSYPQRELDRLTKMLSGSSVAKEKRDDFAIRSNILKRFQV